MLQKSSKLFLFFLAVFITTISGCGETTSPNPIGSSSSSSSSGGGDAGGAGGAGGLGGAGGAGGVLCEAVDDGNPCTDDICDNGVPTHPPSIAGTPCTTGGTQCDGLGSCVECLTVSDCPGSDDECSQRACDAGICNVVFTAANTLVAAQTPNDCQQSVCDGNGKVTGIADDNDVPVDDGNACTDDVCNGGMPSDPNTMNGASCSDNDACTQTDTCQAGACVGGNVVTCVALSADGTTLAVGTYTEDSNATGIGGNQADNSAANAGAVYVY